MYPLNFWKLEPSKHRERSKWESRNGDLSNNITPSQNLVQLGLKLQQRLQDAIMKSAKNIRI